MKSKTLSWIGIILTVIIGWDKLIDFLNALFTEIDKALKATPPVILIGLIIWLFWFIGKSKER